MVVLTQPGAGTRASGIIGIWPMADPQTIQRIRRIAGETARVGTCLAFVAATTWAAFSFRRSGGRRAFLNTSEAF